MKWQQPAENVSQTEQALDTIIANIVKDIGMIMLVGSSELSQGQWTVRNSVSISIRTFCQL
jgi:hypothetical protein